MKAPLDAFFRKRVLAIVSRFKGGISAEALALRLGVTPADLRGDLIALSRAGLIRSVGNTRAAVWVRA
jgi:predicted ArsR family transcriptional regulator